MCVSEFLVAIIQNLVVPTQGVVDFNHHAKRTNLLLS